MHVKSLISRQIGKARLLFRLVALFRSRCGAPNKLDRAGEHAAVDVIMEV